LAERVILQPPYTNGDQVRKVVYLDQNVISDLRDRKILKMSKLKASQMKHLLKILTSRDTKVVYSHVTLSEIYQIKSLQYRQEHINVLNLLEAVYIDPISGAFSPKNAESVWQNYIAIMQDNIVNGCNDIELVNRSLVQKVHGLDVSETFEEIYTKISNKLSEIAQQEQTFLESFDFFKLEPNAQQQYEKRMSALDILKLKIYSFQALEVPEEVQISPKYFRQSPVVMDLELETAPIEEVVKRIESYVYSKNGSVDFINNFSDSKKSFISRAYSLMNWAGYHADDFQKSSKEFGDRLRASLNDMSHVASAVCADVILTEDKGMLGKAPACYAYMGKSIKVCTVACFLPSS
jgi:hypothetical protein